MGAFLAGKRKLVGVLLLLTPAAPLLLVRGYLAATIWTSFVLILFGVPLLLYKLGLNNPRATKVA